MRFQQKTLLAAALLLALAASPALANHGHDYGRAAPGPIAGAGLGYLALTGGYYVFRRWRKRNTEK